MLPDTFSRTPAFSVPTSGKKHKFSWRFITALHWNLKSCRMIARYSPLMSAMHSATFGHLRSLTSPCRLLSLWWAWQPQGGIKIWWSELCDRPGYLVLVVRALPLNCCPSNSEHLWTLSCFVLHQLYNIPCLSFQICYRTFGLGCVFFPLQNRGNSMAIETYWDAVSKPKNKIFMWSIVCQPCLVASYHQTSYGIETERSESGHQLPTFRF